MLHLRIFLHQRGMLQWIEHPELGRIVVQSSPMRYDGAPPLPHEPSKKLGASNEDVLGWLGLSRDDVARFEAAITAPLHQGGQRAFGAVFGGGELNAGIGTLLRPIATPLTLADRRQHLPEQLARHTQLKWNPRRTTVMTGNQTPQLARAEQRNGHRGTRAHVAHVFKMHG